MMVNVATLARTAEAVASIVPLSSSTIPGADRNEKGLLVGFAVYRVGVVLNAAVFCSILHTVHHQSSMLPM